VLRTAPPECPVADRSSSWAAVCSDILDSISASCPAILLVDDSEDTLEMYALGLSLAGYRVVTAQDAPSAIGQLSREPLDAVVTDLTFPGTSGWDLIQAIRNDPSTQRLPVVVLTGHSTPSIASRAKQVGCAALLTKPCLPDELARTLHTVLPHQTDTA
jgi:CheY-like chemotaxis protein